MIVVGFVEGSLAFEVARRAAAHGAAAGPRVGTGAAAGPRIGSAAARPAAAGPGTATAARPGAGAGLATESPAAVDPGTAAADGTAAGPATAAADGTAPGPGTGARVEMVGATGAGPAGDRRLLELATAGVGHATVIRTGADRLDPADLDLALRYLPDLRAIVLIDPDPGLLAVAAAAADWAAATLVVVGPASLAAHAPGDGSLLLEPPLADPDGTFAGFVAALALRLDAGDDPETAFRTTTHRLAADPVRPV